MSQSVDIEGNGRHGYDLAEMERAVQQSDESPAPPSRNDSRAWLLVLLGLFLWQCWMTLTLFAPPPGTGGHAGGFSDYFGSCWQRLLDDQPIVSGSHPFHLYFGFVGAQSFREQGSLSCYDPSFQAGYPKTPVFDSGSRPAELFLLLGGSEFRPAAYKIGLAACSLCVPLLLALAAWGVGFGRGVCTLAVALGLLVWWSAPGQEALHDGDLDLLFAALAVLAHVALLVHFNRSPGPGTALLVFATAALGCFAQPVIFLLMFPLLLVYYLSVGHRHPLGWHVALGCAFAGAIAINYFWLADWIRYWWIRLPLQLGAEPLPHRTINTVWNAPLWGEGADRLLLVLLFVFGIIGVIVLNESRQRPAARLLGLGAGAFLLLTIVGLTWKPLGRLGAAYLLLPALWFSVLPASFALARVFAWIEGLLGCCKRALAVTAVLLLAGIVAGHGLILDWASRLDHARPLEIGLGADREQVVEVLRQQTTAHARILWEDRLDKRATRRWSALLPILTDRAFLGGLDPEGSIEHAYASFNDHVLAGRPIQEWSDAELAKFCRRYNIGWIACWSPEAVARYRAWDEAVEIARVTDEGQGYLFAVRPGSFVLKGKARWLSASRRHIALADVVPENGEIVLSLHYQTGLKASPGRVHIERESDPYDPIPFIRLRVPEPVARVTLTWDGR